MTKVKGVPQHVADKLNLPELPKGYYFKFDKDKSYSMSLREYRRKVHVCKRNWFNYPTYISTRALPNLAALSYERVVAEYELAAAYVFDAAQEFFIIEKLWSKDA